MQAHYWGGGWILRILGCMRLSSIVIRAATLAAALVLSVGPALAQSATLSPFLLVSTPSLGSGNSGQLVAVADVSPESAWAVGNQQSGSEPLMEAWSNGAWHQVSVPLPISQQTTAELSDVTAVSPSSAWAVGYFDNQSGSAQPLVEKWNGQHWRAVTTPSTSVSSTNTLSAISADTPSDVWAVGSYQSQAGVTQTLVEHWQGSGWTIVTSPNPDPNNTAVLTSVAALSPTDVWAAGYWMDSTTGNDEPLVEQWNGSVWNIIQFPVPDLGGDTYITAIAVASANDIWAVGDSGSGIGPSSATGSFIGQWNGTQWTLDPTPVDGSEQVSQLNGVAVVSATLAVAVGALGNQPLIEMWNGSRWVLGAAPSAGDAGQYVFLGAAASSAQDIWIVGNATNAQGNTEPVAAHSGLLPKPAASSTSRPQKQPSAGAGSTIGSVGIVVLLVLLGALYLGYKYYLKSKAGKDDDSFGGGSGGGSDLGPGGYGELPAWKTTGRPPPGSAVPRRDTRPRG